MFDSPSTLRSCCLERVTGVTIGILGSGNGESPMLVDKDLNHNQIGFSFPMNNNEIVQNGLCSPNVKSNSSDAGPQSLDSRISTLCASSASDANDVRPFMVRTVAEDLLERISERGHLTDEILITLFSAVRAQLNTVKIHDASLLTTRGLRILKGHNIKELKVMQLGVSSVTINDLIGCLSEFSLSHLHSLNVSYGSFTSNKFAVLIGLSKLRQLRSLDVSHTEFSAHGLEIVCTDLPVLEHLNISATRVRDISPLKKRKEHLVSLSMYNLRSNSGGCEEFIPVLLEMNRLVYLDLSDDRDNPHEVHTPLYDCTIDLVRRPECFPRLKHLDISGRDGLDVTHLHNFMRQKRERSELEGSTFVPLEFIGLTQTSACFDDYFIRPPASAGKHPFVEVTGTATETQILASLRRYSDRPPFLQKALYYLYNYTLEYEVPRPDVIEFILPIMRRHNRSIGIQMAATACLYNLTKGKNGNGVHPHWLTKVTDATLDAMENFPNHQQLQKNTLLTLCSDRILQDVSFDRFRCTKLVMDSLVTFNETSMNRMAVAICSILAAKISTIETSTLGAKPIYMETLLRIVASRIEAATASGPEALQGDPDIMLKFTMSALWNLTDESPTTCEMFLEKGGMKLYLKVLKMYANRNTVETKILGLLNNIAEVDRLRHKLINDEFLTTLRSMLHSSHIDVSYFAAGIFSHLLSDRKIRIWAQRHESSHSSQSTQTSPSEEDEDSSLEPMEIQDTLTLTLDEIMTDMEMVVIGWKTPEIEMVAYRSFIPFLPLLCSFEAPPVQLWALWAIHHVCSKNSKRYCDMLISENVLQSIVDILERILADKLCGPYSFSSSKDECRQRCIEIIRIVQTERPNTFRYLERWALVSIAMEPDYSIPSNSQSMTCTRVDGPSALFGNQDVTMNTVG